LLTACKESRDPDLYPLVLTALSTAARQGELLSLTWPDVNLQTGTLTFRNTKNGTTRAVPLVGPALELLRARSKVRRIGNPRVFPRNCDGAWRTARTEAGMPKFRFHDLRHAAASYLAMSGASLRELADILGHKTLAMVKRYSHLTEQHVGDVLRRMVDRHVATGG
jgi:integrase